MGDQNGHTVFGRGGSGRVLGDAWTAIISNKRTPVPSCRHPHRPSCHHGYDDPMARLGIGPEWPAISYATITVRTSIPHDPTVRRIAMANDPILRSTVIQTVQPPPLPTVLPPLADDPAAVASASMPTVSMTDRAPPTASRDGDNQRVVAGEHLVIGIDHNQH
jgi:hypothetical protein